MITLSVFMLMLGGLIMNTSTAQGVANASVFSVASAALKQGVFIAGAFVLIIFLSHFFKYKRVGLVQKPLVLIYLVGMFLTALIGSENGGSRAWIQMGGFSLQPSEFGKVLAIAMQGFALYRAREENWRQEGFWSTYSLVTVLMIFNTIALIMQKDYGTMIIFLGINLICFLVPGTPGYRKGQRVLKLMLLTGVLLGSSMIFSDEVSAVMAKIPGLSHITVRVANMKDPYADIYGDGYQPANALYSLAEGGLFGQGLGNSSRKYGYLTQADSDYVFAIVVDETGMIGVIWIVLWNGILWFRLFYYAFKASRMADKVVLCGTAAYFMLHFIINIGGVGALIPMTGVPLLMISYGGSALIACSMAIGIAQNRIAWIMEHQPMPRKTAVLSRSD